MPSAPPGSTRPPSVTGSPGLTGRASPSPVPVVPILVPPPLTSCISVGLSSCMTCSSRSHASRPSVCVSAIGFGKALVVRAIGIDVATSERLQHNVSDTVVCSIAANADAVACTTDLLHFDHIQFQHEVHSLGEGQSCGPKGPRHVAPARGCLGAIRTQSGLVVGATWIDVATTERLHQPAPDTVVRAIAANVDAAARTVDLLRFCKSQLLHRVHSLGEV